MGASDVPLARETSPGLSSMLHPVIARFNPNGRVSAPHSEFGRVEFVSIASSPGSVPGLLVVTPDEALHHARPLPDVDMMALEDVPDEDWDALLAAIADK